MLKKEDIREYARSLGFEDTGFTGPEAFGEQKKILQERMEGYAWAMEMGLDLIAGTDCTERRSYITQKHVLSAES